MIEKLKQYYTKYKKYKIEKDFKACIEGIDAISVITVMSKKHPQFIIQPVVHKYCKFYIIEVYGYRNLGNMSIRLNLSTLEIFNVFKQAGGKNIGKSFMFETFESAQLAIDLLESVQVMNKLIKNN